MGINMDQNWRVTNLNCCLSCRNEEILRNLRNELSGACARVHKDLKGKLQKWNHLMI